MPSSGVKEAADSALKILTDLHHAAQRANAITATKLGISLAIAEADAVRVQDLTTEETAVVEIVATTAEDLAQEVTIEDAEILPEDLKDITEKEEKIEEVKIEDAKAVVKTVEMADVAAPDLTAVIEIEKQEEGKGVKEKEVALSAAEATETVVADHLLVVDLKSARESNVAKALKATEEKERNK